MPKLRRGLFLSFFILLTSTANAQSPQSAQHHFDRGWAHFSKGDFERAIVNFTRVIETARPPRSDLRGKQTWNAETSSITRTSDTGRVIFVSPLTAAAYLNRGLARFQLGDIEGALSDWDQALAINPRLVQGYKNRASIRWIK